MFKFQDDELVKRGASIELSQNEVIKRFKVWLRSNGDYLRVSSIDGQRIINVSRFLDYSLSHVWIDQIGKDSIYATEIIENTDFFVATDSGDIPRKYFLTDVSLESVVMAFLKSKIADDRFKWVGSDVLYSYWD